jgi:GNAT superfamily N-acetyltransferase
VQIRRANEDDADAISALIQSVTHYFTLSPDGVGAEAFLESVRPRAVASHIKAANFIYFAGFVDGRLAGVVAIRDLSHLYHLFVAAEFQRRGIARTLWNHAKQAALLAGSGRIFTVNSTPYAVPVYERFGFRATGPRVEANGIAFIPMASDAQA